MEPLEPPPPEQSRLAQASELMESPASMRKNWLGIEGLQVARLQ